MNEISGGVTAAKGFLANGIHCGLKKQKPDFALIYSKTPCTAAAVFTTNLVKAAPVKLSQENIANGKIQAIIVNSGNANACNADGMEKALAMAELAAKKLDIPASDVLVASTGVIGQSLDISPMINGIDELAAGLSEDGSASACAAIMTTDTFAKEAAVEFEIGGKPVRIGGITKGSGMIKPNMATMLGFVTTDCAISAEMLKKANKAAADETFNMISVDGDTSTNDTFAILANGEACNVEITEENADYYAFVSGLIVVTRKLARMMARDGEGATKLLVCKAERTDTIENARLTAKGVICSNLFKAAMFGEDANWGRVLCAIGYSGAEVNPEKIDVSFESDKGKIEVCRGGFGVQFSEEKAAEVLSADEISILVSLNSGDESAEAYGCDLTYNYVKINGDYRS